ncbi:hypothetical protein HC725_12675 [Vibrio sp. S17_S38]|uniref:hypothetical protein n=1 Tax=Vibrio sp. S17_S38 TaxID=2720229 RepID=UPI0016816DE2|nr:hypothetical protein [Vibrio sp. S17_S38]MBD1574117.1 hypothetical protein [Vibrio sp. S17_S38]
MSIKFSGKYRSMAFIVSAMSLPLLSIQSAYALESQAANVMTYETVHFSTDLGSINSKSQLIKQLHYAQLLH